MTECNRSSDCQKSSTETSASSRNEACEKRCGKKRAKKREREQTSDVNHPGNDASVFQDIASPLSCTAAAQEGRDATTLEPSGNIAIINTTPSQHEPETTFRSNEGILYKVSDCSHDFDEVSTGSSNGPKESRWYLTPKKTTNERKTGGTNCCGPESNCVPHKRPRITDSQCTKPISPERVVSVFRANSILANRGSGEAQASLLIPDILWEVRRDCYNKGLPLEMKVVGGGGLCDIEEQFKRLVPDMNTSADKLMEKKFDNIFLAHLALCQMIRSFVPSLCANIKQTVVNEGHSVTYIVCSTIQHRRKKTEECCKWKATLVSLPDEKFQFSRIDHFDLHKKSCIENVSRFVPTEITFQESLPPVSRQKIMAQLNQRAADQAIFSQRHYRDTLFVSNTLDQKRDEHIAEKDIDWSVTSLSNPEKGGLEKQYSKESLFPPETSSLLKFLSLIKAEDNAYTFFEIKRDDPTIATVNFMWPEGAQLLATHSDVIFCDSMWDCNSEKDFLLTIVVIDKNYKLRLAAAALSTRESEEPWKMFFSWVKRCVPEFNPKCFVSDDASYIHSAFDKCINPSAFHITCWWHKSKRSVERSPSERKYRNKILNLAYDGDPKEIDKEFNEIARDIIKSKMLKTTKSRLLSLLKKRKEQVFVKLKLFTGGTLSNSFAESINSRLRSLGINTKNGRMTVITILREYCKQKICCKPFKDVEELSRIMTEEVIHKISNGVLTKEMKLMRQVRRNCDVISAQRNAAKVNERVDIVRNGVHLSTDIAWDVTWNMESQRVHCTCNELTYGGIPCKHIILAALDNDFKIPLSCFNPRFFDNPDEAPAGPLPSTPTSNGVVPPELPSPCECQLSHEVQEYNIDDAAKSIEDTIHITEAWHAGKHADEQSMSLMSYTRALEIDALRLLHLKGTGKGLFEKIDSLHRKIIQELEEHQQSHPTSVVMEHARKGTRMISWRNYPAILAQETDKRWNELHKSKTNQAAAAAAAADEEQMVFDQAAASVGDPASAAATGDSVGDPEGNK